MNTDKRKIISVCIPVIAMMATQLLIGHAIAFADESGIIDQSDKIPFERNSLTLGSDGLGGIAWADFNGDGKEDIFLTNGIGGLNSLFVNKNLKNFKDVAIKAGVENGQGASGVIAVDFDGDGYTDIFTLGDGGMMHPVPDTGMHLYKNLGDGTFEDVIGASGLLPFSDSSISASVADIDKDGDLDLFIASLSSIPLQQRQKSHLYRNMGNLIFEEITEQAGIIADQGACVSGFSDYDNDGDVDLFVGNCNDISFVSPPVQLFRNEGNGIFTDVTVESGLYQALGLWMGITFGDFNNDGHIDFFVTNAGMELDFPQFTASPQALLINNGDGTFTDVAEKSQVANHEFGWGATSQDFNNDGWLDIFYAGNHDFGSLLSERYGNPGHLFINKGNEDLVFEDSPQMLPFSLSTSIVSAIASADYNRDGKMDIAMVREAAVDSGNAILWKNDLDENHWLQIRLIGEPMNSTAVGARVSLVFKDKSVMVREVYAGTSLGSTETSIVHFGMGEKKPKYVEVRWPSGEVSTHRIKEINKRIEIELDNHDDDNDVD